MGYADREVGFDFARVRVTNEGIATGQDLNEHGGAAMADKGSKDKGKKEQKKAPKHTLKEKKQLKKEKKNKPSLATSR